MTIVVGAGLAGLSAALTIAKAGRPVTVIEKRPFAGGKTYSFTDPQSGAELDNGQHVFMRCCTAYVDFLREIGALDRARIQDRLRVPVMRRDGRAGSLSAARLPAPLHLGPSFLRYAHLSAGEKFAAGRLLLRVKRMSEPARLELDGTAFNDFLHANGQSDGAIASFWDLVTVPTLNGGAREVSTALALFVFKRGFLADAHAADLGLPAGGLSRLHVDPAIAAIEAAGGSVRLRAATRRIIVEGDRATGVELETGERLDGDIVLAVPHTAVGELLPPEWRDQAPFDRLCQLDVSPIVNLHVWYDRLVMGSDFAAFLDTPVQWVFNRSRLWHDESPGQHLAVSMSAAHREATLTKEELERELLPELAALLPAARDAQVLRTVVIKEPEATFAAVPGSAALRPGPGTPIDGLVLAGAYTDTGWPATMESAVRSGRAAAKAILGLPARSSPA